MNILQRPILAIVTSVLAVLALLLVIAQSAGAMAGINLPGLLAWASPKAATFTPNYLVAGKVLLDYSVPGSYTDTLTKPDLGDNAATLGDLDLAIQLVKTDNAFSGFVDLDKTLVYPSLNTVDTIAMGPSVTGSLDGDNLTLLSEKYKMDLNGRDVWRQFQLKRTVANGQFTWEYRETIWGYTGKLVGPNMEPEPITVVGSFTLAVPAPSSGWSGKIYLPVIKR